MHTTAFTAPPRPTTPRPGFYSGCTRDDLMSILYPHGREVATLTAPSTPTSNDTKPKRKRFGGLVKSVSRLFRKGDLNKSKGPNTLVAESISSTTELKIAEVIFDASEELDGTGYQAGVGLGSGSESADAPNELVEAHSDPDLESRFGSSDSIAWSLLPRFPGPPASLTASVPATGRPNRPGTGTGNVVSSPGLTSEPSSSRCFSTDIRTKRSALSSLWLFKHRPGSGECNRKSVFRQALDIIKTRRLRPLHLSEKAKAEASNPAKFSPAEETQVQDISVPPASPVPDVIVTAYEDSTRVVVRLEDSDYRDSELVEPGLLFPDYIRENYPTARQFTELPRLTLSMSDWNTNLMAIAEDEEDEEDEGFQSRFSDSDSESDLTSANDSGSSSQDSSPPLTPMLVEIPLPPAVFAPAGKSTSNYEVDDRDNAVGVSL
ncbi:hypothetical protein FRC09_009198 [Ceratobasidium sp. 395]|nr:hypothetical protein FRC09_009198 [Ceratobasidium sp. 395]